MSVIPKTRDAMIEWYTQRQPIWEAQLEQIGVTAPQCTELKNRLGQAVDLVAAAKAKRESAKTATEAAALAVDSLRSYGAGLVSTIRAFAEATDDDQVLIKAEVPLPKPPTPVGPPTSPTDLSADPHANGTITLKWKGTIQGNQWFAIDRKTTAGNWVRLDSVRAKKFTDLAVPMNTNIILYRVYGQRGTQISNPPAEATVNFGNVPAEIAAAFRTGDTQAA